MSRNPMDPLTKAAVARGFADGDSPAAHTGSSTPFRCRRGAVVLLGWTVTGSPADDGCWLRHDPETI